MSSLSGPLVIKAYFTRNLPSPYNAHARYLEDILSEYKAYSKGKLKYSFMDPGEKEETKREVDALAIPPLRFTDIEKDKYEIKEGYMGLVFMCGDKKEVIPLVKETNGLEYDISSVIKNLVSIKKRKVGFLSGHGEMSGHSEIDVTAKQGMSFMLSSMYDVSKIDLKSNNDALKDVDSLIIFGPQSEINEEERYKIDQFLMKGRTVGFFIDKNIVEMRNFISNPIITGLDDMLQTYGVKIEDGFVLDRQNQAVRVRQRQGMFEIVNYVNYPLVPVVTKLNKKSVIVKGLDVLVMPYVSPLNVIKSAKDAGKRVEILAESSDSSWMKYNLRFMNPMEKFEPAKNDKKGPFPLAVTVEGTFESAFPGRPDGIKTSVPARILVVGTSRMVDPEIHDLMNPNASFFMNAIDWLVQDEALIAIRTKGVVIRPLKEVRSAAARSIIKYANILFMPVLFIGYGLIRQRFRAFKKRKIELAYQ